ncbi:MAG TPA: Rid family detoxifying hydrolase [Candidatus Limnocylindria bacterium]|nr:Rid family detoxifying hydrolase [Candidatus Limnocylindria bacterium]
MSDRRAVTAEGAPAAIGPYSHAVVANGLVFAAGQVGSDPATGELVEGGVTSQAKRALANVEAILRAAGSGLDRVVKTTIFLADMADFAAVNEAYAERMPEPYPARTTVAVRALPKGALVEIECVGLATDPRRAS